MNSATFQPSRFDRDKFNLYRAGHYHELILSASSCRDPSSEYYLYLLLAAIGRVQGAILALSAKLETLSDPIWRLQYIYALAKLSDRHHAEPIYRELRTTYSFIWKHVDQNDITELKSHRARIISTNPIKSSTQVRLFRRAGATIEPHSYSTATLVNLMCKAALRCEESQPMKFLYFVSNFGPSESLATGVRNSIWFRSFSLRYDLEKPITIDFDQLNYEQEVIIIRDWQVLAASYYVLGDYSKAFVVSYHASRRINNRVRDRPNAFFLKYKCLTMAIIASLSADRNFDYWRGTLLEKHLVQNFEDEVIAGTKANEEENRIPSEKATQIASSNPDNLNPNNQQEVLNSSSNSDHPHQVKANANIRRSTYYSALARIAYLHTPLRDVIIEREKVSVHDYGSYKGKTSVENYILSAVHHPSDDPLLYEKYHSALWAMLVCGGIDMRVIWLFAALRCHYKFQSYFVPPEPPVRAKISGKVGIRQPAQPACPTLRPSACREIENRIVDQITKECISKYGKWEGPTRLDTYPLSSIVLLPTVFEERMKIANGYFPEVKRFLKLRGNIIRCEDVPGNRTNSITDREKWHRVELSERWALLWENAYIDLYGTIPPELEPILDLALLPVE